MKLDGVGEKECVYVRKGQQERKGDKERRGQLGVREAIGVRGSRGQLGSLIFLLQQLSFHTLGNIVAEALL